MTLSIQLIQVPPTETVPKREFYLNEFPITIGRNYSAEVCLPDLTEKLSRSHLMVFRLSSGRYQVSDISTNGSTINGGKMAPKTTTPLADGDVLGVCGYKLLIGILENVANDAEPVSEPRPTLDIQTDFSADTLLIPDAEVEEIRQDPDTVFSQSEVDLDPDLMFDPFAEGPELIEGERQTGARCDRQTSNSDFAEIVQIPISPRQEISPNVLEMSMQTMRYRENVNQAIERTIDRFLQEIDPAILQKDYDQYISRFSRRKSRYWSLHRHQFEKRKSNGEFRRNFMALFVEEIRKL